MSALLDGVWPLRPLHVLLVTDDSEYAREISAAADAIGATVTVTPGGDIGAALVRAGANVVVFDPGDELPPPERDASEFAASHPHVVVGVVATGMEDRRAGNFVVAHRWTSPERLLDELARVYLSLRIADQESQSSAGF